MNLFFWKKWKKVGYLGIIGEERDRGPLLERVQVKIVIVIVREQYPKNIRKIFEPALSLLNDIFFRFTHVGDSWQRFCSWFAREKNPSKQVRAFAFAAADDNVDGDDHEDDIDSGSLTWTCPKAAGGCTSQNQVQSNRFKNFLLSVNKQMITLKKEILPQTLKSICDILTREAI